jgi:DNA-binding MarR family transcriptional regulator
METRYQVLHTLYEIVKDKPDPQTYLCRPREIILRTFLDWSIIHQNLKILEEEKLITTKQLDTLVITITKQGMEMIKGWLKV